ncbi:diguanylate cyclase domain-containing protein [Enterocloster bolteae]
MRCSVTASIGIALYPRDGATFEDLYQQADRALYDTKQRGKDGFTIVS